MQSSLPYAFPAKEAAMRPIRFLSLTLLLALSCSFTPSSDLGKAVAAGKLPEVQRLLASGANPNPPVSGREPSPLAWAARLGRTDIMEALLQAGADAEQGSGVNGWTPLVHCSAQEPGRRRGAAPLPHPPGQEPLTAALSMAAGYGTPKIVEKLLQAGATPTADALTGAVGGVWDIDAGWNGCGPHTESVRALLAASPDLRLPDDGSGRAALRFAEKKGCTEMVSLLKGEVRAAR
jgi:ankyrin repeat protein